MSFYLRPPKGVTNLHKLEETVVQRLKCYEHLNSENILEIISEMDCLIEDGIMDRLGHYIFRLAAMQSTIFFHIFSQNETKLLDIRLSCYKNFDLREFLKRLRRQVKIALETSQYNDRMREFLIEILKITNKMLVKEYFNHITHKNGDCPNCESLVLKVPFYFCTDLLSSRTVKISTGLLYLYPFQFKKLLLSLYQRHLGLVLNEMKSMPDVHEAFEDERISDLVKLTKTLYFKKNSSIETGSFDLKNIENESKLFPLCMNHLYNILKKHNRLAHNDRFDFSLFLKSIGMSLKDSMRFWEEAYSKQHATCAKCTHTWQTSEKRYIYGIRHMYGLEGGRKNYSCKSCHQIENNVLGTNQDGGCPFKHFNDSSLTVALKTQLPYSSEDIQVILYERKENSRKACMLHMEKKLQFLKKPIPEKGLGYATPAHCYLLIKSCTKDAS